MCSFETAGYSFINKKKFQNLLLPLFVIVIIILPHIAFLDNKYIDTEPYYVKAGLNIKNNGLKADLSDYLVHIANPLFTSILLAGSYVFFPENTFTSRLTILIPTIPFLLFLYFYMKKKESVSVAFIVCLLTAVNPMFLVYSQYVCSDVPYVVFSALAIVLYIYGTTSREAVISAVLMGFSLATKINSLILYPLIFISSCMKNKTGDSLTVKSILSIITFNAWYISLSFLIGLPVVLLIFYFKSQVNVTSLENVSWFLFSPRLFTSRVFAYILWLGLFIGPLVLIFLIDFWQKVRTKYFLMISTLCSLFVLMVTYFIPVATLHIQDGQYGEMNLGWVEKVIPEIYLSIFFTGVITAVLLFVANILYDMLHTEDYTIKHLFVFIVFPLLMMSLTRVANRYVLIILVPLAIYSAKRIVVLSQTNNKKLLTSIVLFHTLSFLLIGIFSNYYLMLRGLEH